MMAIHDEQPRATTAKPLNIRQLLFVSEYLKDFNGAT
jgi:hypothetical protein